MIRTQGNRITELTQFAYSIARLNPRLPHAA
jgi:hypothetical protein